MSEDWRLRVTLAGAEHAEALTERLESLELTKDVVHALGHAIAVSRDGDEVFLYADTHAALEAAERIVRADLAEHGRTAKFEASRWHPDAEDWEAADASLAQTAAQREAEHARLMRREDAETAADGFADFEARAVLPTHRDAHELSERLTREGVPHVRRWRYVLVGAADEDAARQWAERLRAESAAGTTVSTEGTFGYIERMYPSPFKTMALLSGGVP